jgi:flagellar motor switch/type III secretory pathway protein FliN
MSLSTPETVEATTTVADPWEFLQGLSCCLRVEVPVLALTVREILNLRAGSIVNSGLEEGSSVGIWLNDRRIASGRFEVAGNRLAVQIVEMS